MLDEISCGHICSIKCEIMVPPKGLAANQRMYHEDVRKAVHDGPHAGIVAHRLSHEEASKERKSTF